MKHGDISNQIGTTIGFRCVDFLVKFRDNSLPDKLLNIIVGKTKRAEVDERVSSTMEFLYRHTEYTVDLIVEESDLTPDMKRLLDDLPFNRVVVIKRPSMITQRLLIGDLTYYVDDDQYRRSLVNSEYAITLDQLGVFINRRA